MSLTLKSGIALAAFGLAALAAHPAQAQTVYFGGDGGAKVTDPHPASNAVATAFDSSASLLGTESFIDFESVADGTTGGLIAPGVTLDTSGSFGGSVKSALDGGTDASAVFGYNTTGGGANYLDLFGGTTTITFDTPIQAFGAYFTGVQNTFGGDSIILSDGTVIPILDASLISNSAGGASFEGFTFAGHSITSITFNVSSDAAGIDDIRYVPAAVPEASTTISLGLLLALGLGGVVLSAKKKSLKA